MLEETARLLDGQTDALPCVPLISKVVPPAHPDELIARNRLNQLFDKGLSRTMMLVCAAEGSGKTTALSLWREHLLEQGRDVCWINIDENDRNPRRFWMNLRYALRFSLDGLELPEQDEDDASRLSRWQLANALSKYALKGKPLVIIAEGFDNIDGSETYDQLIELGFTVAPQVHLCLSSRRRYAASRFFHAGLSEAPVSIESKDLAFTRDEFDALIQRRLPERVQEDVLDALFRKTEGWPYGVELALSSAEDSSDPERELMCFSEANEALNDFFEQRVFRQLPNRCQDFLLQSSALSYLLPRLCSYCLDCNDAEEVIEELLARNAFVSPTGRIQGEYVLSSLFYDWVNHKAQSLPREMFRRINARASHWLYEHGYPLDAVKHQIMSLERADIYELVQAAYPAMSEWDLQRLANTEGLTSVQSDLPAPFCLLAAWAYVFSANKEMAGLWIDCVRDMVGRGVAPEAELSLSVLTVKERCLSGDFEQGLALAATLSDKLVEECHRPLRVMLANCYAEAFDICGDFRRGREHHRKMTAYAGSRSSRYMSSINSYEVAYLDYAMGRINDAIRECQAILASVPSDFPVHAATEAFLAYLLVTQGEEDNIEQLFSHCQKRLESYHNVDMFIDAQIAFAWWLIWKGEYRRADEVLIALSETASNPSSIVPRGRATLPCANRALLALLVGDIDKVITIRGENIDSGAKESAFSELIWGYIDIAIAISSGLSHGEALSALSGIIERAEDVGLKRLLIDLYLEASIMCMNAGEASKAFSYLKKALDYAVPEKIITPFVCRAESLQGILASFLGKASPSYQVRSFIRFLLRREAFVACSGAQQPTDMLKITKREKEILRLMALGYSREELVEELCVSANTLKTHLSHLYGKLGVSSYGALLKVAADLGCS